MVTRSEPGYTWDFSGGHLALDFTNTVGSRGGSREEHFLSWDDALSWAVARGILSPSAAARSHDELTRHPGAAQRALRAATELREALYAVFADAASVRPRRRPSRPPIDALATLNRWIASTFAHARLQPGRREFVLATGRSGSTGVEAIAGPVVRAAVDLLTSANLSRVRTCADPDCAWLFLDTTRNRTRRWCDMKVCGNRDKVRRFRENLR